MDMVEQSGGRITLALQNRYLMGKVSVSGRMVLEQWDRIKKIYSQPVKPDNLPDFSTDEFWFVSLFNDILTYTSFPYIQGSFSRELISSQAMDGESTFPKQPSENYITDDLKIVSIKNSIDRFQRDGFPNEVMIGLIIVIPIFVQCNGELETPKYYWSMGAEDTTLRVIGADLAAWSHLAQYYHHPLTFRLLPIRHDSSWAQQPYEPFRYSPDEDSLWINALMVNVGFTDGYYLDRVFAFNDTMNSKFKADWTYTGLLF